EPGKAGAESGSAPAPGEVSDVQSEFHPRTLGPRARSRSRGHPGSVPWTDDPQPREWFRRGALELARDLLGSFLVRSSPEGVVVVRLTEVEAYRGSQDPASHAFRGPTSRNATMFGDGGHLYVYRHMGLHACANVAAEAEGVGHGVLLRAGEVVEGVELALRRRTARGVCRSERDLARGPARLTVAAGIGLELDGTDVASPAGE